MGAVSPVHLQGLFKAMDKQWVNADGGDEKREWYQKTMGSTRQLHM